MEPVLEVEGRHALFFDDDANAAFVNSKEALVEWNSLFIDRYDVRHLLSNPPPSFRNLNLGSSIAFDSSLESQLDIERYADLTAEDDDRQEVEAEVVAKDMSGYHNVSFSYGSSANSTFQKNSDVAVDAPTFRPPFPLPESLLQNLPPTEKLHQIIARTAIFVSEHGGQSEIVLRVKQGDNPTFGFLMPDHHLHPYFRYLVDNTQLLKADNDSKPEDDKNDNQRSGALSLLGSVYGSGEDEDGTAEVERKPQQRDSGVISDVADLSNSHQSEQVVASGNIAGKDRKVSKLLDSSKVKESALSKNRVFVKPAYANGIKKDTDVHSSSRVDVDKSKVQSMFPVSKGATSLVDPPSEVKRLVDRMVEIILKNGKDFENVLIEQDKKHGKFQFLLPSNQYHQYYLEVLKKAQEARVTGKSFGSEKDFSSWQETDKKCSTKESNLAMGELPLEHDQDRKEKFKMVINKSKKESQDQPSKETQHTVISVDAAAAILQAATRGMKKPYLNIFSKTSHPGSSDEVAQASSGQYPSSAQRQSDRNDGNLSVTVPVAKEFAKTAAVDAAGEADSSEAGMTREQKLKAERLRRAKMFAAMIKSGSAPLGKEPLRASSVEPSSCGVSGVASTAVTDEAKEREGSVVLEQLVKNGLDDEHEMKSRKTRHYRSRQHDNNEDENEVDDKEDDHRRSRKKHKSRRSRSKDRHKRRRKHSSKSKGSRHHSKHEISSEEDDGHRHHRRHKHDDSSEDDGHRHHRRHKHDDSSEDDGPRHHRRHKHEDSSEDDGHRHHRRHKHVGSSDEEHVHHRRHKHDSSSEDEHWHHHRHKHDNSSEDEHKHYKRRTRHDVSNDDDDDDDDCKHRRRKHKRSKKDKDRKEREDERCHDEVELEEGEIRSKSTDQSPSTTIGDDDASREASVGVTKSSHDDKRAPSLPPSGSTEVPDELRAKIRAMLLATM